MPEILSTGLAHPEGPALAPDGGVIFVETRRSRLSQWRPATGLSPYWVTGGSPNACAIGDDGIYFAQAGGGFGGWEPAEPQVPSIQLLTWSGRLITIADQVEGIALRAPNDLCFGADGRLYFTDPGRFSLTEPAAGYLHGLGPDGSIRTLEVGPTFPNGVAASPDGAIIWAESYTGGIWRWATDGSTDLIATIPAGHIPDGLALAADGTIYVASIDSTGLDVIPADGGPLGFIQTGARPLNCAFWGESLLVTCDPGPDEQAADGEAGLLLRVPVGQGGAPVFVGTVPPL